MCWTQCSMASQETPKAKKRKSLAGQGPLKEAVRSTLSVEEEEEWSGRELVLLQLPSSVDIYQLNGKQVCLDPNKTSTLKIETGDNTKVSRKRKYEIITQGGDTQTCVLVPSQKPGRLKAGPPVCKCLSLQQLVEVPAIELPPAREESELKVQTPSGLKQRWKPFGHRKPAVQEVSVNVMNQKVKKKSKKHSQK
ncbi:uncharacterized protein LOC135346298 isoform X2 [Halichondria panicea]|uniref:uncharacterized protein LOC135346298 isoform X2 n=1 Tax=Halichondria panicea TaxID=6063 RepID=UPI00312B797C